MEKAFGSEVLVGREDELATIDRALVEGTQHAACIALAGEPGIGKTRLLRELCRRAERLGCSVLEGRGTEFEQDVPFALVVDALDRHLAGVPRAVLRRLGSDGAAELAAVFPSLAQVEGRSTTPLQAERYRCHAAVRALLEQLAQAQPIVLALDDVHWADEASGELVSHLLRHKPQAPVVLALAYRPRQLPRRLAAVLAAIDPGQLTRLHPAPLTASQADQLLGERFDAAGRRALYRESGGNPFYLEELARLAESTPRGGPGRARRGVPSSVSASLEEELTSLSAPGRAFVQAAAVTGEPFDVELATAVAGLSGPQARDALEELLRRDLVRPAGRSDSLVFRHPILRRAVYESAGQAWRLAAHARAAQALRERDEPAPVRAHHVERSGRPGDRDAVAVLTAGAHAVSARAPATAVRWFRAALELLPADDRDGRLQLLIPLVKSLGALGRIRDSRAALAQALELVPAQQAVARPELAVARGRILGAMAGLDHVVGGRGKARALIAEALDEVGETDSVLTGVLQLELSLNHWFAAEWEGTAAAAREALVVAREVGNRPLTAEATVLLALAEYNRGATGRGLRYARDAARLLAALPPRELGGRVRALLCLGHAGASMELLEIGQRAIERGLAVARATGQSQWFVPLQAELSIFLILTGRLREARGAAEAAHEAALLLENPYWLMWALAMRSWVARLEGDLPTALEAAEEAVRVQRAGSVALFRWFAGCHLGAALIESGEPVRGRERVLAAAGGPGLSGIEPSFRTNWFEILAGAELAAGDVEAADAWVVRSEDCAARFERPGRVARARRGRAALLLARGDAADAAELAGSCTALFQRWNMPLESARSAILHGRALAAAGDPSAAREALDRAHSTLAGCGAARYRDEAARELRRLGRRVDRPGTRARRPGGLTGRQLDVARLVARGMTNRAIADELFVSEKTVETHLARAFVKLGVSSRAALAGAVNSGDDRTLQGRR